MSFRDEQDPDGEGFELPEGSEEIDARQKGDPQSKVEELPGPLN